MDAVRGWQASPLVHPLACGNDSNHQPLESVTEGVSVVLRCPDCGYVQPHIPDIVIEMGAKLKDAGALTGPVVPY